MNRSFACRCPTPILHRLFAICHFLFAICFVPSTNCAADFLTLTYPPSKTPSELSLEATFHLWLPPAAKYIRAVIVHQHGCGSGAERFGDLAIQDLHWRALAATHDAALLSPHYRTAGADCSQWYDPRKGSAAILQRGLDDFAKQTTHPEVASAPLCLWGHSGGGIWASFMLEQMPERIIAVFCRSGAAAGQGGVREPNFPPEAYRVPVLLNPGLLEKGNPLAWDNCVRLFETFRVQNAPVAFAPDPLSKHDCRNSRLLAIPYFDACLKARLPRRGQTLKPIDLATGRAGNWQHKTTLRWSSDFSGSVDYSWLPDKTTATAFTEYVSTGITADHTPPRKSPVLTSITRTTNGIALTWTAEADLESGIREFVIYRDGKKIATWPEKFDLQTGHKQFQGISFHDTPVSRRPPMAFTDPTAPADTRVSYAISTVNGSGLEGLRSKSQRLP